MKGTKKSSRQTYEKTRTHTNNCTVFSVSDEIINKSKQKSMKIQLGKCKARIINAPKNKSIPRDVAIFGSLWR